MKKILIVEDDPNLSFVWAEALEEQGFETITAGTVEAAMKALLRNDFDLFLLDLFVADGNTIGLSDYIAIRFPGVPTIMLTGTRVFPKGEHISTACGVGWFLRKPVKLGELEAMAHYLTRDGMAAARASSAGAGPVSLPSIGPASLPAANTTQAYARRH